MPRRKNTEPAGNARPGKQVATGLLPGRPSRAATKATAAGRRPLADYAKSSPADASGVGQIGYNLHSMGRS